MSSWSDIFKILGISPRCYSLQLCIIGRTFTSESWKTRLENVTSVMQSESEVIFKPRKTDPGRVLGSLSLDESIQIGARVFSRVLELGSSKEKILTADGRRWNPGGMLIWCLVLTFFWYIFRLLEFKRSLSTAWTCDYGEIEICSRWAADCSSKPASNFYGYLIEALRSPLARSSNVAYFTLLIYWLGDSILPV